MPGFHQESPSLVRKQGKVLLPGARSYPQRKGALMSRLMLPEQLLHNCQYPLWYFKNGIFDEKAALVDIGHTTYEDYRRFLWPFKWPPDTDLSGCEISSPWTDTAVRPRLVSSHPLKDCSICAYTNNHQMKTIQEICGCVKRSFIVHLMLPQLQFSGRCSVVTMSIHPHALSCFENCALR